MNSIALWINTHVWQFISYVWITLCLLLLFIEIVPRSTVLMDTYKEWYTSEKEIKKMDRWETKSVTLTRQAKTLEEQVDALYISIPRNDQMSVILDCLQESSDEIPLSLLQIKTGTPVSMSAHQEQPISVLARGTFHALGTFIDRVEQSPYLIKVKSLDIKREGKLKAPLLAQLEFHAIVVDR